MATQSKYVVGAALLTTSLLLIITFYKTNVSVSASPYSQGNYSRDLPVVDYIFQKPHSR